MTCTNEKDFFVRAGETFHPTIRWGQGVLTTVAITSIAQSAPAQVSVPNHNLPNGWRCAVVGVAGMVEINDDDFPPTDWHTGIVINPSTVALAEVSSASYSPYASGGWLVYELPHDLTGSATFTIYANPDHSDAVPLAALSTAAGTVALDTVSKTITPFLQTAGLAWTTGFYRLDFTDTQGIVTEALRGTITIDP